jgi:NAD(P)-dependent dehydrogenase (short-subunit alcohol dehydrogenase family)
MTLPLARDMAQFGIRVVTIAPGLFDTPMFSLLPDAARQKLVEQVRIDLSFTFFSLVVGEKMCAMMFKYYQSSKG